MKALKSAQQSVINHVTKYFQRELPQLEVITVLRKHAESAPDNDSNLYFVIAKGNNSCTEGQYSCWTCWNESTQSLNSGHYYLSLEDCFRFAYEFCDSLPLTYEAKSGLFIKNDDNLLSLEQLEYSYLVNKTTDLPNGSEAFTLNDSDLLIIALKTNTEA